MHTDTPDKADALGSKLNSFADHTSKAILDNLFSQNLKSALMHVVASFTIMLWLYAVANVTELSVWVGAINLASCFALFLGFAYKRYADNKNRHLWMHVWAGCSALIACIYAAGLVHFTPFDQAQYAVALGLFIVTLSAINVMMSSASKYAATSFSVPIIILPSYYLTTFAGQTGVMTAITLACYSLALVFVITSISNTFKKSIVSSLQQQQEQDKRKRLEQQLQDVSRRDGLTGIFNRRYFDEMLEAEIGRAHRNHQPLCVLMLDVDCFELYNKHYGHIAGDTCLINIAEIANTLANRKGDLCARYGGEEFAIILPNIDLKGAVAFANKLQLEVQKRRIEHASTKLTTLKCVTISIGVTNLMPFTKSKPSELVKYAQTALFEAKRQGRNRVHFTQNNGLGQSASL